MKNTIVRGQSLGNIEKNITEELIGKELWGDINVSEEEYECLKERIKDLLNSPSVDISFICRKFPNSITTFMIFLVRYKYNTNFWGLMSRELEIPIYSYIESEIGECARKAFIKNKFDFSDVKNERRVNLEPILYEAGYPPESSLDDLFYILKYDTYSVFDPQLIIDDLVAMRSYQIRKPMLRFLRRFKNDRAIEFVLEVHDAMLSVDRNMIGESRYIGNYIEWKEHERSKETTINRKKQEFQARPYLTFENGKRGLCLILPHTIMGNEWIEDVEWIITVDNGTEVHKKMVVFGDEGRRYVESVTIPVSAARHYTVTLKDNECIEEHEIISWTIDGIKDNGIIFFNSNGRMVSLNYLQMPYGIMILAGDANITDSRHTTISYQSYPTDRVDYCIASIEPTGRDASVTYNADGITNILNVHPQVNMNLEGKTLFSMPSYSRMRLYTEIPKLIINIDDGVITNGLSLKIGREIIDIEGFFKDGEAAINLKQYSEKILTQYGTYSIRLYQYDHFLRQIEFNYVPKIKSNYSPIMQWPDKVLRKDRKVLKFEKKENWILEFEGCVVSNDEENYIVECPSNAGSIYGSLKSNADDNDFVCSFELPVNPFKIDILDSQGMIQEHMADKITRLSLSEIEYNEYWVSFECFGEYRNSQYKLKLRTANGIEQEENFILSQNGCGNFNLAAFYNTLRVRPLPAQIELWCDDDENKVLSILIVADTVELNERPTYLAKGFVVLSLNDDGKDLVVKRFGVEEKEHSLLYRNSRLGKSKKTRGYPCKEKLEEGIYVVEGNMQKSEFLFEDETGVELSNGNNTMYVSAREKNMPIVTFSDWLDQLVKDIISTGVNNDIRTTKSFHLLPQLADYEDMSLSKYDYERLVAIAYFANAKCVDAKKKSIADCMREISSRILTGEIRLEIIRFLAELRCPQEVFDICLQEYNLFLFEVGSADAKSLAEKLENNSTELSMLLLMGIDDSVRNTIWREKYRELIGREAIRSLLYVPNEEEPSIVAEEQKRFMREQFPCKVRINLTNEIAGDMEPIQKMIEITHKSIYFNKSKKPDFGIYFDHIRYVDQYVNWYSLSHNKQGEMEAWKKEKMLTVVQEDCKAIIDAINNLEMDKTLRTLIDRYEKALRYRFVGDDLFANMNTNNHQRYFYLQGMAAFLAKLPSEYRKYGFAVRTGEHFMANAIIIAPRMARRDLVMAGTFIYLVRKEEKLCR